jgi:putative hydrolase of the HAD superfamily
MHIPSQVRCVLFDAVGTLIYADPPVSAVYAAAARSFGLNLDESIVKDRFATAFAKQYAGSSVDTDDTTSEYRERGRWRAIVADVFVEIAPCDALFECLWNHFARPTSWRLYEDAAVCWQSLKRAGFQVGIASNFDQRLLAICAGLPPLDHCEYIFPSSQLGWRKPAALFFRAIEEAMALKPDELMLVGDDWDGDYLAATSAGWHAVYLQRNGDSAASNSIRSLFDLI